VFKQHGICQELVSDRDPKFISSFWRQLQTQLGTRLKMSTAHRPQSDGQTERVNRNINEYLRAFVNHEQNDWDLHLHLAEYAYNDASHSSTGQSPFLLDTGRHPVTPNVLNTTDVKPTEIPAVNQTLKDWRDILEKARTSLQDAQNRQAVRINQNRRPREYVAGNEVMVSTAHILSDNERTRPANKWLPKYLGPFQVLRKVSTNAYKIDFPQTIRVHGTVNVEALKDYRKPCSLHAPSSPLHQCKLALMLNMKSKNYYPKGNGDVVGSILSNGKDIQITTTAGSVRKNLKTTQAKQFKNSKRTILENTIITINFYFHKFKSVHTHD